MTDPTAEMARSLADAAMAEIKPCLPPENKVLPHHLELMRTAITRSLKDEIQGKLAAEITSENAVRRSSIDILKDDANKVLCEVIRIQNRARVLATHHAAVHLALAAAELSKALSELSRIGSYTPREGQRERNGFMP
jgi:hypothetical protein